MKKTIAFLLALIMVLALAACGTGGEQQPADESAAAPEAVQAGAEPEATVGDESAPEEEEEAAESVEATIDETVLADEELFQITANSLEGPVLNLSLENKSDLTLSFTTTSTNGVVNTVNGYAINTGIHEVVGPGETVETEFGLGGIGEYGIVTIADIQLGFEVRDDDSYDLIAYVPAHLQTSEADYDYSAESFQNVIRNNPDAFMRGMELKYFSDEVDFDCSGIRILSAAVLEGNDRHWLYLEFENTTDENLRFSSKAVAYNGLYMWGSVESVLVPAGKKAVSRTDFMRPLDFSNATLFDIDRVSEMTIIGAVTTEDDDNWIEGTLGCETFTLKLEDGGTPFVYESASALVDEAGIRLEALQVVDSDESVSFTFTVVNNTGEDIRFDIGDQQEDFNNPISPFITGWVNGSGVYLNDREPNLLPDGETGVAVLELSSDYFEYLGISGAADVTELESILTVKSESGVLLETPFTANW